MRKYELEMTYVTTYDIYMYHSTLFYVGLAQAQALSPTPKMKN